MVGNVFNPQEVKVKASLVGGCQSSQAMPVKYINVNVNVNDDVMVIVNVRVRNKDDYCRLTQSSDC